jgi:hypothetical protein
MVGTGSIADSDGMKTRASKRDYLLLAAVWLLIGTQFWRLQDDWAWTVLFPVTGFVWMTAPMILTRFRTRSLLVASAASLALLITSFLAMLWGTLMFFGLFGPLIADFDQSSLTAIAPALTVEGLKVVPGAVVGAVVGLRLRSSVIPVPAEWLRAEPLAGRDR